MATAFGATGRLRVYRVRKGLFRKAWSVSKHGQLALFWIVAALRSLGRDRLYLVPDRGSGLWMLVVAAPLLRAGFHQVVLHHHVWGYLRHRDRRLAFVLWLLGARARHIVLSEGMAGSLAAAYRVPPARIMTLGNAAHLNPVSADPPPSRPLSLGFLGNITADKGIMVFMTVVRILAQRGHPVAAHVAGPVDDPGLTCALRAFVAEDPERRHLLGSVDATEKKAFFNQIDTLLFPSSYAHEALPLTIYEALAANCPVLATPMGAIPEQIDPAWLLPVDGFDVAAADQITVWQDDPAALHDARTRAQRLWHAAYLRDCAALDAVLQQLAGATR
ncbi:MAG: glycosyltransferase family 4 protein [Rhodobacteraceae bacterium]|nr:glycosyltransferase family 4 protein [Paracoccaceae bacterium]